ncbi:hypothetical protein [Bradyrhizobium sp. G127]|uniref:hypothetical protein n=1 Tax=Bradyrhizobium sp. G127 TaxID=2904800 RepID=UPI001F21A8C7|nr:hypothetical protein [Bradyrhizobium sp. G127]MCF2523907.1 hypothetical protein [Bradyrhizobium sp. G127]
MGFLDTLLGKDASKASKAAAADTYAKQQTAIGDLKTAGNQYATDFKSLAGEFQPYQAAGTSALERLMAGLGLGGNGADFTAAYRATPGYQAGLSTGLDAINRRRAAGGMLDSGNADIDAMKFGSDYEDQRSQQYLGNLGNVATMGQNATGQYVNTVGQGLTGNLGAQQTAFGGQMNAAGTIGQGMVAGANAEAGALGNLLKVGGYLGGAALGGGWGSALAGKK